MKLFCFGIAAPIEGLNPSWNYYRLSNTQTLIESKILCFGIGVPREDCIQATNILTESFLFLDNGFVWTAWLFSKVTTYMKVLKKMISSSLVKKLCFGIAVPREGCIQATIILPQSFLFLDSGSVWTVWLFFIVTTSLYVLKRVQHSLLYFLPLQHPKE
jgi:hypothetical protein